MIRKLLCLLYIPILIRTPDQVDTHRVCNQEGQGTAACKIVSSGILAYIGWSSESTQIAGDLLFTSDTKTGDCKQYNSDLNPKQRACKTRKKRVAMEVGKALRTVINPIKPILLLYSSWVSIYKKSNPVQALRLCTGRTAHRGNRGIALLFHYHGTRRG